MPIPRIVDAAQRLAHTTPGEGAAEAARAAGLEPVRYQPPVGEPMRMSDLHFHRNDPLPDEPTSNDDPHADDPTPTPQARRQPRSQARPPDTQPSGRPEANGPPATDAA